MGWATVPLLTVGVGSPISFAYAAVRKRSGVLALSAVTYGAGVGISYNLLTGHDGRTSSLGLLLIIITWIVSTAHAITVRPRLYPPVNPSDRLNRHAVEVAKHRRGLRDEARRIAKEDLGLARELRIGRPDLPRAYDDGGLIDVNHAPPHTLALLPGLADELVARVVRLRSEQGAFVSAEELAVQADLPPEIVPALADYAIFLP